MFVSALVPAMEKCMIDADLGDLTLLPKVVSVLDGERFSFQLAVKGVGQKDWAGTGRYRIFGALEVEGLPMENITIKRVKHVPSLMPALRGTSYDINYISTKPGFFPDLIDDLNDPSRVPLVYMQTHSYWIEVEGLKPGNYGCSVSFKVGEEKQTHSFTLKVIDAKLPEQTMTVTQWFHTDCLTTYYDCEVFSERYWRIVENFAKVAVRNGINMLLTPVFTPPLDTYVGGERPTVQLVDVTLEDGKYSFGFEKLDRWIEMCNRCGIKYLEISHFFTQWGAEHAPKIIATVNGEKKKIFGWESDAAVGEYPVFLRAFVSAFLDHMKARGDDQRCYFHISDEPNHKHIEQYKASRNVVADLLEGYHIMDALSKFEFYEQGILDMPIPSSNHMDPFIENDVKNLWTYYCTSQNVGVSNRFFAMPGSRTRGICAPFYKYDIVGFLQWGYNFYFSQYSYDFCNPYLDSTGDFFAQSGDTYSVYPSHDGRALESVRIAAFSDALQDV